MKSSTSKATNSELVTQHIQKLAPELIVVVEYLRQFILKIDPSIGEQIKWNNPCFYYTGEMKAFDPKEYKREIVVMNLFKGRMMLVLPSGAKVKDTSGLLQGDYKDGRKTITFADLADVKSKEKNLKKIIQNWLEQVD